MPTIAQQSTFKRVAIGATFTCPRTGDGYRKSTEQGAIRLLPNGRGQTHAPILFARSHAVLVHPKSIRVASAARDGVTAEA